jgi:hypothetical protein
MRFGQAGVHESMLNALDANSGGMRLFAPQYVTGDDYRSSMAVINLEEAATMLTVEILDSQGRLITAPTQARLPARGSAIVDEAALFGTQPARRVEGYARITSSASRITGAVFFGDSAGTRFRTALPMITEGVTEAVFPHLAEDSGYFTGVAAVNLSAQAATVTVSAYDPAGQPLGAGTQTLAGGNRFSLLLRELIPSIPPVSRGYFQLRSNQPLASFAVFGTRNLSALSALPAQPRARTPFYGAAKDEDYLRINADSDFVPPRGGIPGGPGPAMVRLMVARSKDGLNFERDGKIVCDQGAVPDMVVDRAGTVYLYYTAWTVGSEINKTVVAISKDRGASWTFRKLNLPRQQGESDLVDPDVLILDDGSFRLYTTIGQGGQYARTHRLDSRDGLVFERKGVAFDPGQQALDPSTIKIGNTYHLFAGGGSGPETNWHGTSPDGAVYTFDKMMTFRFNNFGQMMANGLAVDGGYRFYCFGNDRKGGITSFFTTDGNTWTADAGYRLSAVSNSPLEDGQPTDPAIGRLSDGTYLLIYSIRIKSQ